MNPQSPTLVASTEQRLADAVSFDCGSVVLVRDVRAFDPAGHTIAFWARWRDPSFLDPCLIENPGEDPYFTTSAATETRV